MKMTAPRPRTAADEHAGPRPSSRPCAAPSPNTATTAWRSPTTSSSTLPNIKLPMYHFTNYDYARQAQSTFDPARPTSLLYKPLAGGGFELVGAMYTAPRGFDEDRA